MRREAHRLGDFWSKGRWTDSYEYALLREEWRAGPEPPHVRRLLLPGPGHTGVRDSAPRAPWARATTRTRVRPRAGCGGRPTAERPIIDAGPHGLRPAATVPPRRRARARADPEGHARTRLPAALPQRPRLSRDPSDAAPTRAGRHGAAPRRRVGQPRVGGAGEGGARSRRSPTSTSASPTRRCGGTTPESAPTSEIPAESSSSAVSACPVTYRCSSSSADSWAWWTSSWSGDWLVRRRGWSPEQLVAACRHSRHRDSRKALAAAQLVRRHVDSPMETRLRMLLVLAGLPEPEVNLTGPRRSEARWSEGTTSATRWCGWRSSTTARLHVEVIAHWEDDLERRADMDDDDWRLVVVIGSGIYKDPLRTLRRVHRVLLARGHAGCPASAERRLAAALPRPRRRRVTPYAPHRCPRRCPAVAASRGDFPDTCSGPGRAIESRHGHHHAHGADSEVGRLATVMLHRPGNELKRLTPRNNDRLLFDGIPWVSRAQEEHDAFAETLRDRGVEVLYLTELLTETLESELARNHAITSALSGLHLGDTMRRYLAQALRDLSPGRAHRRADRGHPQRRGQGRPRPGHQPARARTTSSSTRCPTCSSPATPACGCATGSPSPAWRCPRASARPS